MNYSFIPQKENNDIITLKRTRIPETVMSVVLFLIALFALPAGLSLFLSPGVDMHYPLFWTGFGLLFLTGGIVLATQIKIPEYLIFDNARGALIIKEKKRAAVRDALVPYADIDSFQVHYHRERRTLSHVVELIKTDGAFWTIFNTGSKDKADRFCARLRDSVRLRSISAAPETFSPASVRTTDRGNSVIIEWKNRYPARNIITAFLIIASLCMLIWGSRPYAVNAIMYYIGLAFMSFIAAFSVLSLINAIGRSHRVEITRETLSYRKPGGIVHPGEFAIPLNEIDSIMFNFSTSLMESVIYVLTGDEKNTLQNIKRGMYDPADILTAIAAIKNARKIDAGPLGVGDKIRLESLLQEGVRRMAGTLDTNL